MPWLQGSLCFIYDCIEASWICDSDLAEHLTVQFNVCLLAAVDELAVTNAAAVACSIDADNPKFAV